MDLRLLGFLAAFIVALYVLGGDSRDDGGEGDRAPERDVADDPAVITLHQMEK